MLLKHSEFEGHESGHDLGRADKALYFFPEPALAGGTSQEDDAVQLTGNLYQRKTKLIANC